MQSLFEAVQVVMDIQFWEAIDGLKNTCSNRAYYNETIQVPTVIIK